MYRRESEEAESRGVAYLKEAQRWIIFVVKPRRRSLSRAQQESVRRGTRDSDDSSDGPLQGSRRGRHSGRKYCFRVAKGLCHSLERRCGSLSFVVLGCRWFSVVRGSLAFALLCPSQFSIVSGSLSCMLHCHACFCVGRASTSYVLLCRVCFYLLCRAWFCV